MADEEKTNIEEEREEAKEEVKRLEEDPPEKLEDWPSGAAKYETFGGPEHETSYEVGGDEVDDPDEYKGEPIPGGPTDPNAPKISGERDLTDEDDDEGAESE
jgi:hypothetical protein